MNKYPFKFENAFFKDIEFHRASLVPKELSITGNVMLKCVDKDFPQRIEIFVRFSNKEEEPIKFSIELVGIFSYIGDKPDDDKIPNLYLSFFENEAFDILWPYIDQVIITNSNLLGIKPLDFPKPIPAITKEK